jgi:hypothetical protein
MLVKPFLLEVDMKRSEDELWQIIRDEERWKKRQQEIRKKELLKKNCKDSDYDRSNIGCICCVSCGNNVCLPSKIDKAKEEKAFKEFMQKDK